VISATATGFDSFGTTLPLTVGNHGKADIAVNHVAVINADILLYGFRIGKVGVMADASFVDRVDHTCGLNVSPFGGRTACQIFHLGTTFAPDITLEDIVIVGDDQGRTIFHRIAEGPAELIILAQVIENRRSGWFANDAEPSVTFVNLITREVQHVGIEFDQIIGDGFIREAVIVLAGERA